MWGKRGERREREKRERDERGGVLGKDLGEKREGEKREKRKKERKKRTCPIFSSRSKASSGFSISNLNHLKYESIFSPIIFILF